MAKECAICNKSGNTAGGYSDRIRATKFNPIPKRRQQPNLQWAKLPSGGRVKICTRCLKAGKHLTGSQK